MRSTIALAILLPLAAQEPRFDVQSRLVLAPVTVTDPKGRLVDGLEAADFAVLDNGRPQKIAVDTFATGVAPLALVIAVQSAGISVPVLEKVRKIGAMIQPLITGERGCAALMSFAEEVRWLQDCTNNEDALSKAFSALRPGADMSARMLDASYEAIRNLRQRPKSRRVLLLISESKDRGSETDLRSVLEEAQTADVAVYAATYSAFRTAFTTKSSAMTEPKPPKVPSRPSEATGTATGEPPSGNRPALPPTEQRVDLLGGFGELIRLGKTNTTRVLTAQTGGAVFPFTRQKGLESVIERLGVELHSQYVLSFVPDDPTPGYHALEVRMNGPDLRVRARPGYQARQ
jgi:VWFA-related protein